jgi:DNA end-binding protein Ku
MATAVWKGQLTFGLVSVPIRLHRAARKERVRLHYVAPAEQEVEPPEPAPRATRDLPPSPLVVPPNGTNEDEPRQPAVEPPVSRITQSFRRPDGEGTVSRSDLLRGHEVAPDQYVTFTQQELRTLRPETSSEMQIVRSVRLTEIDPVYFESSYYVAPDRAGERAYSLLYLALKESGYVALATVAMHGRDHVVVIRPGAKGLLAHMMYYKDEVRAEGEFETKMSDVPPKEVQLAKTFVEAIAGPFAPEDFADSHRQRLEALISTKLARGEVAASAPVSKSASAPAGTLDILEALKRSIEQNQQMRQAESAVPRREPGRVTEIKKPKKRHA